MGPGKMVTPIKTAESGQYFSYGAQERTCVKRRFYKTDDRNNVGPDCGGIMGNERTERMKYVSKVTGGKSICGTGAVDDSGCDNLKGAG